MPSLTLIEWGSIAQILITVITAVGVFTSIYISIKALREVQADRKQRQRPHLMFEYGGEEYPIELRKIGKSLPGVDTTYAEKVFSYIPDDAESIDIEQRRDEQGIIDDYLFIGTLNNYGVGPALATTVTWVPKEISIGSESFVIDYNKLKEPIYASELNTVPASPSHIMPNDESGLTRLPTYIVKDFEKKISSVDGILEIKYKDVFGTTHTTKQVFYLFTNYKKLKIHITFSDLLSNNSN